VAKNKGTRIHSTTKVRDKDLQTESGVTEWVYCGEDLIHDAFRAANEKFVGGDLHIYYLQGIDTDTGLIIDSINEEHEKKKKNFPTYSGKITTRVQRTTRKVSNRIV
jgi:hypothetical protein